MISKLRYLYNLYVNKTIFPFFIYLSKRKLKKYQNLVTGKVLDIGCGDRPYKKLFKNAERYMGTNSEEYYKGNLFFKPGPDDYIVNDGCDLPFSDKSFDVVLSLQVLPVFESPDLFFREVHRLLRPEGVFIITSDFLYPLWNKPYNYFRVTSFGFELLAKRNDFNVVAIEAFGGYWTMCARNFHKYIIRQMANFLNSFALEKKFVLKLLKALRLLTWILFVPFIPLVVNIIFLLFPIFDILARDEDFTTNYIVVLQKI